MLTLILAATWPFVAAESSNGSTYSVAAITYSPTQLQQVGHVKAGLLCLPKGKLRWRDVARPEDHALAVRIESALKAGGLSVAPQPDPLFGDAPPATAYRIRISVTEVKLRLCVEGFGIGVQRPKSQGTVTVQWQTYDRVAREQTDSIDFTIKVDDRDADARTASHIIGDAIVESAKRYAIRRSI